MPSPLNANLDDKVLPASSSSQLVKTLFIGDSQMGQSTNRLMGQVGKWNVPFAGRYVAMENQTGTGIAMDLRTGAIGGATVSNSRLSLGEDWGNGNVGTHHHHSRKITVTGNFSSNFNAVAGPHLTNTGYTVPLDMTSQYFFRAAFYSPGNNSSWAGIRLSERRSNNAGISSDHTLTAGTEGYQIVGMGIRNTFNNPATKVGAYLRNTVTGTANNRNLNIIGAFIYRSPWTVISESIMPANGFLPAHISASGWSAFDHLNTLTNAGLDSMIEMAEGFDTVMVMLGHNVEDNGQVNYVPNLVLLKARITARHVALGFDAPQYVFIAPWPAVNADTVTRLSSQTAALYDHCRTSGDGFINLFDYFGGVIPSGSINVPRLAKGTATYTLDPAVHPNDASTAQNFMLDIEWNMLSDNWVPDQAAPVVGLINPAYLAAVRQRQKTRRYG